MTDLTPPPPVVTWATVEQVSTALGASAAPADGDEWLAMVTAAANQWTYRKRLEAGYGDDPTVAPSTDVALATVLYALALYRERSSTDSFSSFAELDGGAGFAPAGSMGQIKRLLGIGKAQTDRLPADVAPALRTRWLRVVR